MDQFRNLSATQQAAVIRMRRDLKNGNSNSGSNKSNGKSISSLRLELQDTMSQFEERIIAGVTRGTHEQESKTPPSSITLDETNNDGQSATRRRSAPSGSVGTFFANQRRRKNELWREWVSEFFQWLTLTFTVFINLIVGGRTIPMLQISMFHTTFIRNININITKRKSAGKPLSPEDLQLGSQLGLDSHADMSCAGRHARIIEVLQGSVCNVKPFHDSYESMQNIQTVNVAYAHDTTDGETYILNVNQCLDFTDGMDNSLLCPNQARSHGVIVDDVPMLLDPFGVSTHTIFFPDDNVRLPLEMKGPISFLPVRYPSDEDMDYY